MRTTSRRLWGGRFTKKMDPLLERYTSSIAVDYRLARYDTIGSIAHAKMLGKCQIISQTESRKLVRGLSLILRAIEAGRWKEDPSCEDIHTQIQQMLEQRLGTVARKQIGRAHV